VTGPCGAAASSANLVNTVDKDLATEWEAKEGGKKRPVVDPAGQQGLRRPDHRRRKIFVGTNNNARATRRSAATRA